MKDFGDAIGFIGDHPQLLLDRTLSHLAIAALAMAIALAVAVPLGAWLGHLHRFSFIAISGGNVGRALPSLAIIAMALAVMGIGTTSLLVALVVLAAPVMLTNSYVAVDGVDRDAVDAARGMGMTGREILWRVELPLALPLVFAGIRTAAVFVVATVPLGAVAGSGGGLGEIIANQASYRFAGVLGASICVAILALLTQAGFTALQRAVTPRGLRVAQQRPSSTFGPARRVPTAAAQVEA